MFIHIIIYMKIIIHVIMNEEDNYTCNNGLR